MLCKVCDTGCPRASCGGWRKYSAHVLLTPVSSFRRHLEGSSSPVSKRSSRKLVKFGGIKMLGVDRLVVNGVLGSGFKRMWKCEVKVVS